MKYVLILMVLIRLMLSVGDVDGTMRAQ